MYRENTFDVLRSRHDNFNFNKVLQKRKEFYKYHLPQYSTESGAMDYVTSPTNNGYPSRRLQYCNEDFVKNLDDKRIVVEITGGDPTYANPRLYK